MAARKQPASEVEPKTPSEAAPEPRVPLSVSNQPTGPVIDEQGKAWPPGAVPLYIGDRRVTWSEYQAHDHEQRKQAVLAELDDAAGEESSPPNPPTA